MITTIDMDELYDEFQIAEFNDKAKTNDGKPLAIGNGKIVDQPIFTDKNNLYTAGQCTWYVFDKRAQDGHTISTSGVTQETGQDKHQVLVLKSIIHQKKVQSCKRPMAHTVTLHMLNVLIRMEAYLFLK